MGLFIIFLLMTSALVALGFGLWWFGSKVKISIKRKESMFEIEQEAHKKIKKEIQEDKENE